MEIGSQVTGVVPLEVLGVSGRAPYCLPEILCCRSQTVHVFSSAPCVACRDRQTVLPHLAERVMHGAHAKSIEVIVKSL